MSEKEVQKAPSSDEIFKKSRDVRALRLKNQEKALLLIDDNIEAAIEVVVKGLKSKDKYYRLKCALALIKKVVPDRTSKEVSGPGGGPIPVSDPTNRRQQVLDVLNVLDEIDFKELKRKAEDGDFYLLETDSGTEKGEKEEVERREGTEEEGEKPSRRVRQRKGVESSVSAQKELRRDRSRKETESDS
jgi:hypothetical protein